MARSEAEDHEQDHRAAGIESNGGAMGIRTPDPLLAKQMLYQLSYGPTNIKNDDVNEDP